MNRNVCDCDIVLELLPLYIEQKTGAESNAFVETHLAECEQCREVYELMSADWMAEDAGKVTDANSANLTGESAKGGTPRRWYHSKLFWVIAGILAYAGLMAGLVIYTFLYLTVV